MPRPKPKERKELNALLRKLVIKRDKEECLRCGNTDKLHMSHIYPKGTYRRMEYDPDNLKLLCFRCHFYFWHRNPIEAKEWLDTVLTPERSQRLKNIAISRDKWSFDYNLLKLFIEAEIKKI